MRDDLPPATRRRLTQQRVEAIRWLGTSFEDLVSRRIDPAPWLASVVRSLEDYIAEQTHDDAA